MKVSVFHVCLYFSAFFISSIDRNGEPLYQLCSLTKIDIQFCIIPAASSAVKPRLVAANADYSRITVIDESKLELSLTDERLEQAISVLKPDW